MCDEEGGHWPAKGVFGLTGQQVSFLFYFLAYVVLILFFIYFIFFPFTAGYRRLVMLRLVLIF